MDRDLFTFDTSRLSTNMVTAWKDGWDSVSASINNIKWELDFEFKSYGIRGSQAVIHEIIGIFNVTDSELDDYDYEFILKDNKIVVYDEPRMVDDTPVQDVILELDVEIEMEFNSEGDFFPSFVISDVVIDLDNKEITITFN